MTSRTLTLILAISFGIWIAVETHKALKEAKQ